MTTDTTREKRKQTYVDAHAKSRTVSFILTVLFGPLGLFYARAWVAAILLLVLAIALFGTVLVPLLCWLASIGVGHFAVAKHNNRLRVQAGLMAGD